MSSLKRVIKLTRSFANSVASDFHKKFWIELFIMTFGMFIAALGLHFFLIPSKLIVGSITGLSIVLSKLVGFISIGQMIFGINAILLILSFILIGNEFGAKTVYTALILGPMIDFISNIVPMKDSIFTTYIGTQAIPNPWFDLLSFVLILSASQAILFSINASTGGLDILAKIFNKYFHIQLWHSCYHSRFNLLHSFLNQSCTSSCNWLNRNMAKRLNPKLLYVINELKNACVHHIG